MVSTTAHSGDCQCLKLHLSSRGQGSPLSRKAVALKEAFRSGGPGPKQVSLNKCKTCFSNVSFQTIGRFLVEWTIMGSQTVRRTLLLVSHPTSQCGTGVRTCRWYGLPTWQYSLATNLTSMATEPASLATQPWHIVKSAPAYHTAELISLTAWHQSSKAAAAYQYPIQTGLFLGSLSVPNIGLCRISPPVLHIGSYYWTPRPTANLPAGFCAWWYNASSQ